MPRTSSPVASGQLSAATSATRGEAIGPGYPRLQLTVVTALILIFNTAFEYAVTVDRTTTLLTALNFDPAYAHRTTDAVTFAVKNLIVIPVYLMAMMHALHITSTR